ncbi:hypothetical protein BMT55_14710 [Listeria newyorkensis]|uniref:Uncharacterized protein n=2 Tax=Listeriaceae TaxID=186820 RepID=A0ABX4XJH8_9LIST|nr:MULTISPECIES: hypothetical protein [Listeria]PNP88471.1 hypothetical protein BMT55_14710 [Listeria newyorkensis]RQW66954.1 hypothetical protein DUK53_09220 [Listeria sp. SHR_NRA_18]WAO23261.1 hypothetical protein OTR81_09640 [Listeria newyorkensis]
MLTILNENYKKQGTEEEIEGLTVLLDGTIKQVFDKIRVEKNYKDNNEVLRDIIFAGVNSIIETKK